MSVNGHWNPSAIGVRLTRIAALNKTLSFASKNCLITTLPYLAISLHCQGLSQYDNHLRLTNKFSVNTHHAFIESDTIRAAEHPTINCDSEAWLLGLM